MTAPDIRRGSGPRRAIWGLVNDGYALVAKTANLSHDDAFELCRVPDIGDPSAYLDQGVAYLHASKWGHVFARYYTNAERDSAGRASLVYDVVALSDADFAAIGNDPFAALPPLASDRRPERFGELPVPELVRRDDAALAARLTELLGSEDPATLTMLLGALLDGEQVLAVLPGLRPETIECLTLLMPPSLRPALTFQAPTVDYPKHAPRLTVSDRAQALLAEREWSAVLPRDAADPPFAHAMATADRLIALGRVGDRLQRAWSLTASPAGVATGTNLASAVAAILRMDQLNEGLRAGDLRRAVLVVARAEDDAERTRLTALLFDHDEAPRVAAALGDVVRGEQRGAWPAVEAVASAVGQRRDKQPDRFAAFFPALIDALRTTSASPDEQAARSVQVLLACAAASLGDLERFLEVADPALPWDQAWKTGASRWVKGRSVVARLFDALASKGGDYADAIDGVGAIASVVATSAGRARDRAQAIGFMLVRRGFRERGSQEPPDKLGALLDGLIRIWSATPASVNGRAAIDDAERAVHRFVAINETAGLTDVRRVAAELTRALGDTPNDEVELAGWAIAALDRAHAGAIPEGAVRVVSSLLEDHQRHSPQNSMATAVGRALLSLAATDAAFVFRPAWADVVREVDDASRRELLARALGWVARGYANGRFTVGALVDACVTSGAEGATLDDATVTLLLPHLVAAVSTRGNATEVALIAATLSSVATPSAAAKVVDALLDAVSEPVADGVRMRRLAHALQAIEQVRDEDEYAEARASLRRALADHALTADEERALRTFLGVDDGSVIGRLLGKLPSLTPSSGVVVGGRS